MEARLRTAGNEWLWSRRRSWPARAAFDLLASANATVRARRPRRVWIEGDTLVRQWSDGLIVTTPGYGYMTAEQVLDAYCFAYRPRPGETVVDVGAGVGDTTRLFAALVGPAGRTVALEAHPGPYACLRRMIELNSMHNVEPVQAALTGESGPVVISDDENWKAISVFTTAEHGAIEVPGLTLDQLCESRAISEIALLQVNIEGAEAAATAGMERAIGRCGSVVICCHDFKAERTGDDSFRTRASVSAFLEDNGFEVTIRDDHPSLWVRNHVYGRRAGPG